ncbi:hypothetical protein F5Y16DRAFT_234913 [Xylariaceae sp. FL0255]|nr:hypothetical protein F5Y16DRAFT_234913 [Xylariaceae sp. FL0255]
MFSHATRTVRITNIGNDVSKDAISAYAEALCESQRRKKLLGVFPLPSNNSKPVVSLAPQSGQQTATITFPSKKLKPQDSKTHRDWSVDDTFDGLTMLFQASAPVLDICAVHGLNGNAFDTFAWEGGQSWLRDFLPSNPLFERSRVMTYGYSSLITDNSNTAEVEEWASGLLREVSSARTLSQERSRPTIFVCHSLGGLIAREAMVELNRDVSQRKSRLYDGLDPSLCGLLFMATPHSGSLMGVWNDYLIQLAQLTGLRAREFSQVLGAFNRSSRISKRDFELLDPPIPYECLYETRKMRVGFKEAIIVTADAAGLNSVTAEPMSDVDHTQICRFPRPTHPGYNQVCKCLLRIQEKIVNTGPAKENQSPSSDQSRLLSASDTVEQGRSSFRPTVLQGGKGTGGTVSWDGTSFDVGGGSAEGGSLTMGDNKNFRGTAGGGTGLGGNVKM